LNLDIGICLEFRAESLGFSLKRAIGLEIHLAKRETSVEVRNFYSVQSQPSVAL
jgi:hypothetical protein